MFDWCVKNILGVSFLFVTPEDIEDHCKQFQLDERYLQTKSVSGTRSHHSYIPQSQFKLQMQRISSEQSTSTLVDVIPGSYVVCIYDSQWFIGNIVEVSDTNQDVYVKFMKQNGKSFLWPKHDDYCWVPLFHILLKVHTLEVQSRGA